MKEILVLDTTLREGEQTPDVSFSVEQKLKIARALDEIGVDMIELGHPSASGDIDEFIRQAAKETFNAALLVHCRAFDRDIDAALATGVQRIALFLGASKTHLEKKLGMNVREAAEVAYRSVKKVVGSGCKARFTAEDATRADWAALMEICHAAVDAGADRISLPDTVGIALPDETRVLFRKMKKEFPHVGFDAHCHNDLGLAVANSLAAFEGRADCIHVTVNGLGERAGITPLCNLAASLKVQYGIDTVDLSKLADLTRMVEEFSGIKVPKSRPVVGEHIFSHKAGVHTSGVLKEPSMYEPFPPGLISREREIVVGKLTGKGAVRARFLKLGIELKDTEVSRIVAKIKGAAHASDYTDDKLMGLLNTNEKEQKKCKRNSAAIS